MVCTYQYGPWALLVPFLSLVKQHILEVEPSHAHSENYTVINSLLIIPEVYIYMYSLPSLSQIVVYCGFYKSHYSPTWRPLLIIYANYS